MASRSTPKNTPAEAPVADDLDSLLDEVGSDDVSGNDDEGSTTEADSPVVEAPAEPAPVVALTPAQERLQAARAALAKVAPVVTEEIPEEDEFAGLSEQEISELKAIEDQLAATNAVKLISAPPQYDNSQRGGTGEKILIHITQDGFTAFGEVWLRGQEIEVEVGTPAYERTKNELGQSWLDLRDDLQGQYTKWRTQFIASGPFTPRPGEKFDDEVARADQRRNRSVPMSVLTD